ncbi:MAG TPA: hypothetical protein VGD27_18520 [Longimicrobiales bacterium]
MRHIPAIALITLCVVAGCSDPPAPTGPNLEVSFDANPASSGATIVRGETAFQIGIFDAERQLLAFHNFRNAFPACGETVTQINLADFLEVHNGNDETLFKELWQAPETFIWVWHSVDGNFLSVRCTEPIAKGVGKLVYTDNDVTPFLGDRARANSWGYKAQGILTGSDGISYHYNGVSRFIFQPDGVGGSFQEIMSISLGPAGQ